MISAFGALFGGEFLAVVLGEDRRRLGPLLALAGKHFEDVVVGQLTCRLAGDLFGTDRGEDHAQRPGDERFLGFHGSGQIGADLLLEG